MIERCELNYEYAAYTWFDSNFKLISFNDKKDEDFICYKDQDNCLIGFHKDVLNNIEVIIKELKLCKVFDSVDYTMMINDLYNLSFEERIKKLL